MSSSSRPLYRCFADWFRDRFKEHSSDIKHSLKLPHEKMTEFSKRLGDLVLLHHNLIPKLAGFFKELCIANPDIPMICQLANTEKVEETIKEQNKVKENEIRLWLSMFEIECYLLDAGIYWFAYYIEAIANQLMCRNEANDVMLMFTVKRCFYRLRKEEPLLFNVCLNYVKKLQDDRQKEMLGDLSYDDSLVNPGVKSLMIQIRTGRGRFIEARPCLTYNALTQAKFFLKEVLADPAYAEDFCKVINALNSGSSNDFALGFGWFIYHLNILCAAKLKEFYPQGRYYQENIDKLEIEIEEAQALLVIIMHLKEIGYLNYELKRLLEFYQIVAIM